MQAARGDPAGRIPVVGLPGNPVAAVVTFLCLARPLVLRLAGAAPETLPRFRAQAGFSYRKKAGRREYVRVRLRPDGALLLAEPLGPARLTAIATATAGVILMSGASWRDGGWRPAALGIAAGALFGLSAIGFRGAILALPQGGFVTRAATVLLVSLTIQSVAMLAWLGLADRAALHGIVRHWRASLWAGALGAFASLFWFMGFALTAAANVRTLALVEVVMAQLVSGRVFREGAAPRQILGMGLIVAGVALLIAVSG